MAARFSLRNRIAPRAATLAAAMLSMIVGAAVLVAAPAHADQGDGLLSCNTGEICFKEHNGGANWYLRYFWYSDMSHWDDYFTDDGHVVQNNVSDQWNRDTECTVYLEDINGAGYWIALYTMLRGQSEYAYVGSSANDRNDGHNRCYLITSHS